MTLEQLNILNEQAQKIHRLKRLYERWTRRDDQPPADDSFRQSDYTHMDRELWLRIPDAIKQKFICDAADWMAKEILSKELVFDSIEVKTCEKSSI